MKKFNAEKEVNNIIKFIRDYYKENNLGGAILGISGGKDSAVVAALMTRALGAENVIGVTLPCHSKKEDKSDAELISEDLGFQLLNVDLTVVFDTFKDEITKLGNFNEDEVKNSDINLKPRLRMATVYYLAALYSALKGKTYLVAGTSNKCELYVGYFTKGGDSVHDIAPISDYTVDEVIQMGEYLNIRKKVLYKDPADGISNQTDEDKLGFKYSEVVQCMDDDEKLDKDVARKIKRMHEANQHKFNIPAYRR